MIDRSAETRHQPTGHRAAHRLQLSRRTRCHPRHVSWSSPRSTTTGGPSRSRGGVRAALKAGRWCRCSTVRLPQCPRHGQPAHHRARHACRDRPLGLSSRWPKAAHRPMCSANVRKRCAYAHQQEPSLRDAAQPHVHGCHRGARRGQRAGMHGQGAARGHRQRRAVPPGAARA
jgi:hypothetical protein